MSVWTGNEATFCSQLVEPERASFCNAEISSNYAEVPVRSTEETLTYMAMAVAVLDFSSARLLRFLSEAQGLNTEDQKQKRNALGAIMVGNGFGIDFLQYYRGRQRKKRNTYRKRKNG